MADLDLLPEPESRSQVPDWAIRVSIAILYFLIGVGGEFLNHAAMGV